MAFVCHSEITKNKLLSKKWKIYQPAQSSVVEVVRNWFFHLFLDKPKNSDPRLVSYCKWQSSTPHWRVGTGDEYEERASICKWQLNYSGLAHSTSSLNSSNSKRKVIVQHIADLTFWCQKSLNFFICLSLDFCAFGM